MLRRLLLVLVLALTGLTAATPALAQRSEAEAKALLDNVVAAGRPAQNAVTASMELLALVLDGAGEAASEDIDDAWLAPWNSQVDQSIARLEAMLPSLAPMSPAEIQRAGGGYERFTSTLQRMNKMRAAILESCRQAIFFAREAQAQARKAAKGDDEARQRLIRIGVSSTRLTLEAQMAATDTGLVNMSPDQPQKPLGETIQANNRASVEIYKLLERSLAGQPADAAGTASRIRAQVAEARRQALLVDPAVQTQLRALAGDTAGPGLLAKVRTLLLSFGPSTQTELQIANLLEDAARRIESNVDDPGDDAWGLDRTLPLVEKRISDHLARVKMIENF